MRKRFRFVLAGSAGDSLPMLAIAGALKADGHYVDCLVDPVQARLLAQRFRHLTFHGRTHSNFRWTSSNLCAYDRRIGFEALATAVLADLLRPGVMDWALSLSDGDTIVAHPFCLAEQLIAEERGLRQIIVDPYPHYALGGVKLPELVSTHHIVSCAFREVRSSVRQTRRTRGLASDAELGPLGTSLEVPTASPWDPAFERWLPRCTLLGYPSADLDWAQPNETGRDWPMVVTLGSHFGRAASNWARVRPMLEMQLERSVLAVCVPPSIVDEVRSIPSVDRATTDFIDLHSALGPATSLVSHSGLGILHTAATLGCRSISMALGLDTYSVHALFSAAGLTNVHPGIGSCVSAVALRKPDVALEAWRAFILDSA